jgi:type IV secretory pathway VirB4 component
MDSVKERIARLRNRYMDVSKRIRILIGLINNSNISEDGREYYSVELQSLLDRNKQEDIEDEIKLLKDAPDVDNDFKISAELQRLRELNRRTQEEIDRNDPITAQDRCWM